MRSWKLPKREVEEFQCIMETQLDELLKAPQQQVPHLCFFEKGLQCLEAKFLREHAGAFVVWLDEKFRIP